MVPVGMGDHDMGDFFTLKSLCQGFQMFRVIRSRINHRHFTVPNDVCICALEGEGAGIVGDHSAYAGYNLDGHAIVEIHFRIEGEFRGALSVGAGLAHLSAFG